MFEYRVLNANIKYQRQWIAKGYAVAFTIDWHDFLKSMTIAEYRERHLAICRTQDKLNEKMKEGSYCVKRKKIGKNKKRYWFLFANDSQLITAIIHTNITLVNNK